ncbi:MAG: acetyl-CoA carboxylase carboxyl transferase subunit alpha [Candidatus Puniceispirillum sp.]|nr:acetyl-CoA carboxylase carboxyl transferase subunit alpha [Candidatus Puniceispirillum sp.]
MVAPLDFEKPIAELESRLRELQHLSSDGALNITQEVAKLEGKVQKLIAQTYDKLSPWQKVLVARHPDRPHLADYLEALIEDFIPLAGDRLFGEDKALIGGLGTFRGRRVVVMGHEKGSDTEARIKHNFGMPRPEGYRKAARLMRLADQFKLPIITFVDTAGAHPGLEAEERGQSEAIARCIETLLEVKVPVLSVITGEGGSGGAIAIAVANEVFMLEHAVYSVISPEGCASILWRTAEKKEEAAAAQKLTAQDLKGLDVIDAIIPEPLGGAHRSPQSAIKAVGDALEKSLAAYGSSKAQDLAHKRQEKFLRMGQSLLA